MKVLILNGSPRKGNTCTAVDAFIRGMENISDADINEIKAAKVDVSPCIACMNCGCEGECVFGDDTNDVVDAVEEADFILFATPVYWWGMTAQLKLIVDKLYSRFMKFEKMNKKVGVIVIGEAEQDDPQYEIIPKQFECICDCLGWDNVFTKTYTAGDVNDLAENESAVAEIEGLWQTIR